MEGYIDTEWDWIGYNCKICSTTIDKDELIPMIDTLMVRDLPKIIEVKCFNGHLNKFTLFIELNDLVNYFEKAGVEG